MSRMRQHTRICTRLVSDDAAAAELSTLVDEITNDHEDARVKWIQTATWGMGTDGPVRMTAIITWREGVADEDSTATSQG